MNHRSEGVTTSNSWCRLAMSMTVWLFPMPRVGSTATPKYALGVTQFKLAVFGTYARLTTGGESIPAEIGFPGGQVQ